MREARDLVEWLRRELHPRYQVVYKPGSRAACFRLVSPSPVTWGWADRHCIAGLSARPSRKRNPLLRERAWWWPWNSEGVPLDLSAGVSGDGASHGTSLRVSDGERPLPVGWCPRRRTPPLRLGSAEQLPPAEATPFSTEASQAFNRSSLPRLRSCRQPLTRFPLTSSDGPRNHLPPPPGNTFRIERHPCYEGS